MMRPDTRIRIYNAAEDYIYGLHRTEITAKYNITDTTYYRWLKSKPWADAVAGRVRQEREPPVRMKNRYEDLPSVHVAAQRYVAHGKPPLQKFSELTSIPVYRLEMWMAYPFWEESVLYAEHRANREKKPPKLGEGKRIPKHLLKQAVFLFLAGWSFKEIGNAVGRSHWSIQDWRDTQAWEDMLDELMLDKLMMHLLDKGTTIEQMFQDILRSQGFGLAGGEIGTKEGN